MPRCKGAETDMVHDRVLRWLVVWVGEWVGWLVIDLLFWWVVGYPYSLIDLAVELLYTRFHSC